MPKYGPYSKEIVLAQPDGRTREGRLLVQMRNALFDHFGGEDKLTPIQRVLIERSAMLQLRLATLDERIVDGGFTEYDSKTYLAWSNSLTRTLVMLGLDPKKPPSSQQPSLGEYLALRGEMA